MKLLEELVSASPYGIVVCHCKGFGCFFLINDGQIGSIIRVGHVCDGPISLKSLPLVP